MPFNPTHNSVHCVQQSSGSGIGGARRIPHAVGIDQGRGGQKRAIRHATLRRQQRHIGNRRRRDGQLRRPGGGDNQCTVRFGNPDAMHPVAQLIHIGHLAAGRVGVNNDGAGGLIAVGAWGDPQQVVALYYGAGVFVPRNIGVMHGDCRARYLLFRLIMHNLFNDLTADAVGATADTFARSISPAKSAATATRRRRIVVSYYTPLGWRRRYGRRRLDLTSLINQSDHFPTINFRGDFPNGSAQ